MAVPTFIITIDTEGDNLWESNRYVTTENARYLPRFQELCERYYLKPVYLTNYEMAMDGLFVEFASDSISRGNAEVGMHLHAWNSPPEYNLTGDDKRHKPYLIEYPNEVMWKKILFITQLLEDKFQTKILSHRAGRWAFNERYATMLLKVGYQVDCSVTPLLDWSRSFGIPTGQGGNNYRNFPNCAYFIDPNNIARPGTSLLLEVPMTTCDKHSPWVNVISQMYDRLRGHRRSPSVQWLRPAVGNAAKMCRLAQQKLNNGSDYVELMLHSSEFMPGGSPTFRDEAAIEGLYRDLEQLFDLLKNKVVGMTLTQYYQHCLKKFGAPPTIPTFGSVSTTARGNQNIFQETSGFPMINMP